MASLTARHIQNYSDASSLERHWGYADRVIPCTNDAGSCAYLDVVYHSHDVGMLYTGIIWATIGGILLLWAIGRRFLPRETPEAIFLAKTGPDAPLPRKRILQRGLDAASTSARSYLLPPATSLRRVFGHTTRLQVLILSILAGYLLLWSFLGISYNTWITPVKTLPGVYNTRTSLGPWSDRVGVLAYALLPLSIMLSSRESLLSLITGVPYQHFLFLHRWLGYIILVQALLHTIGWTIIEAKLYQPQPSTATEWIKQTYMVWGCVAIILLVIMAALTTPFAIRRTGYEFFRKAHYVVAMLFLGACWGHWAQLKCFLLPSLILWSIDRAVRIVRTLLLHYSVLPNTGKLGFNPARARIHLFPDSKNGDVVRLDFEHQAEWAVGRHFFLCFLDGSVWQSHPFTPLSFPNPSGKSGSLTHSYVFRAKKGETKKIAEIAALKHQASAADADIDTRVILTGPYGVSIVDDLPSTSNVLCVAGGPGITFVLPVLLHLIDNNDALHRNVELVWVVRKAENGKWVAKELEYLRTRSSISVRIFVTREDQGLAPLDHDDGHSDEKVQSSRSSLEDEGKSSLPALVSSAQGRPDLPVLLRKFIENNVRGSTTVFASGPAQMTSELRTAVAASNAGTKVWKGDERHNVKLVCDDRSEW